MNLSLGEELYTDSSKTHIDTIGKIVYEKKNDTFYFIYTEKGKNVYTPIRVKDKYIFEKLKNINHKFVHLKGVIRWTKKVIVEQPKYLLGIDIKNIKEFNLDSLRFTYKYQRSPFQEINYNLLRKGNGQGGIFLGDKTTNTTISGAGVLLGIAIGPISLIPFSIFTFKTLVLDD